MKKILSLVLAAAMLTTVAFAGDVHIGKGVSSVSNPGKELYAEAGDFNITLPAGEGWRFSSEYFTIASKKFTKGANLVKEVKFDDDENQLLVVLNDNYELVRPTATQAPNLVIDKLEIKAKKTWDSTDDKNSDNAEIKKNKTYVFDGEKTLKVGFDTEDTDYKQELASSPKFVNGELVKFVNDTKVYESTPYETAEMNEGDIYLEGRVYKDDKVYVKVDNKVNKDILKASEEADIRFYNIKTNGFPSTTTINLTAEEDEFVYKIVDGKIAASGLKWSADDYAWVGKIRSGVSYVVSDVELKAAPATGEAATGNPDTGANDVVGIAAALAVVSLVAAGAVSLKK